MDNLAKRVNDALKMTGKARVLLYGAGLDSVADGLADAEDFIAELAATLKPEGEQISALRAKVVKFISKNDPFGDVFSQHELAQLEGCDINRVKEVTPMSAFEIIPDAYGIMDGDSTRCAVRRGTMGETSGLLYIDTGSRFVRIYEIEPNRFKDADERMWTIFFTPSEQISALRAKVVKFISKNDPFGDVFSQHELAQLEGCDINRIEEAIPDCEVCGVDCAGANPPVYNCPQAGIREAYHKVALSAKGFIDDWTKGDFSLSTLAALDVQSLDDRLTELASLLSVSSTVKAPPVVGELYNELRIPLHELQADMKYLFGRASAEDLEVAMMLAQSVLDRLSQIESACYRAQEGVDQRGFERGYKSAQAEWKRDFDTLSRNHGFALQEIGTLRDLLKEQAK